MFVVIFCARDSEEKDITEIKIGIAIKLMEYSIMVLFNTQQILQIGFKCYIHLLYREL